MRPKTASMIDSSFSERKSTRGMKLHSRLITAFAAGAMLAILSGCAAKQQNAHAAGPRAVSVAIAKVQQQDMPVYLVGLGSVTAFNTANIKSRVDGQMMQVNFKEGQLVKQGELLAVIDPRPYQVRWSRCRRSCSRTGNAARCETKPGSLHGVVPSGSIAQQQVDTQKALVDQLEAQVRTDQAQIDNAKLQIMYCHITAPINGRVGLRLVDPGNMVHATDTTPMLILTQLQPIAVIFTLPEDVLPQVSQHMKNTTLLVEAYSRDDQTKLATGKLLTIDNQIDQTTGTGKLKAVFDNKDSQLWPNQFVNTQLLLETRKNATVMPAAAIQRGPQGTYVYAVKADNTVEVRPVTVAFTQGNTTAIASGLTPGDTVVTDGQDKLDNGSKIEPRAPAPGSGMSRGPGRSGKPAGTSRFMNPSRLFILRPVATTLLMVGVMLVGLVAYLQLPVSALPEVDYPTIQVVTFYPGADPDVMASSVTAPLERQFGQVPGLSQMTSTSSFGSSVITLQFALDQNIDVEEQQVQAAINAGSDLSADRPAESSDLQQGESGRLAHSYPGADFGFAAAFES